MKNKFFAFLVGVIGGAFVSAGPAKADTEYVVNAFNIATRYIQKATNVVNEVSLETQKIASGKIMPGGWLGDKAAEVKEKIQIDEKKMESLREQKERLEKRIENARQTRQSLIEKYQALNEKLAEYKEKADEAIAEGQRIKESYQTYRAEVFEAVDSLKGAKEEIKDSLNAKETTTGKTSVQTDAEANPALVALDENEVVGEDEGGAEPEIFEPTVENKLETENLRPMPRQLSNKAEIIQSAGVLAREDAADSKERILETEKNLPVLTNKPVLVEDVLEASKKERPVEKTLKTTLGAEEQLVETTTRVEKPLKKEKGILYPAKETVSGREKFLIKEASDENR